MYFRECIVYFFDLGLLFLLPCMAFYNMAPVYLFIVISYHSWPQTLKFVCPPLCIYTHVVSHYYAFTNAISPRNSCPLHLANY